MRIASPTYFAACSFARARTKYSGSFCASFFRSFRPSSPRTEIATTHAKEIASRLLASYEQVRGDRRYRMAWRIYKFGEAIPLEKLTALARACRSSSDDSRLLLVQAIAKRSKEAAAPLARAFVEDPVFLTHQYRDDYLKILGVKEASTWGRRHGIEMRADAGDGVFGLGKPIPVIVRFRREPGAPALRPEVLVFSERRRGGSQEQVITLPESPTGDELTIDLSKLKAFEKKDNTEAGTFHQSLLKLLRNVSPIIGETFLPPPVSA